MGKRNTVYSANAVTFTLATLGIESGRGPDEFLKIEQQSDDFSHGAGLDGESVWNELLDKYTLITVTLMQTSAGNGVMWGIHKASLVGGGLPSPVFVKDRKGATLLVGTDALIIKTPDQTYAKEAGTTIWVVGVDPDIYVVGGH